MLNNNNIPPQLPTLTPAQIQQLSPEEMRSMLIALQQPAPPQICYQEEPIVKTKQIFKFRNKKQLRDRVKRKLERRSGDGRKLREASGGVQSWEGEQKSHQDQEGKLNFKQSALLQTHLNNSNNTDQIPSYLAQTSLDELCCPICLQTLISPALTNCGHTFCAQCIDQSLLIAHTCPTCRQNIRGLQLVVCPLLDKLIRFKVELSRGERQQEYDHYMQRVERHRSWKKSRYIDQSSIRIGQTIDVRDTETIWCQATVSQIYTRYDRSKQKKVNTSILVHYNRWHNIYNQIIEVPSNRFAPLNYFSSRSDIIHYNLAESQGNVRGSVAHGPSAMDLPPNLVQYIRIEESDHDDSFLSHSSDIEEISDHSNLSHLAPGQAEEAEEISHQSVSDNSSLDLMEYVNRIRTNVLHRLAPHERRQYEDAINLEEYGQYGEDDDDYQYVPSASLHESPPEELNINPQSLIESNNYSLMLPHEAPYDLDLMNSLEYPGEMMGLLKDNSDEEQEMFGPEEPSNMFEEHYG